MINIINSYHQRHHCGVIIFITINNLIIISMSFANTVINSNNVSAYSLPDPRLLMANIVWWSILIFPKPKWINDIWHHHHRHRTPHCHHSFTFRLASFSHWGVKKKRRPLPAPWLNIITIIEYIVDDHQNYFHGDNGDYDMQWWSWYSMMIIIMIFNDDHDMTPGRVSPLTSRVSITI